MYLIIHTKNPFKKEKLKRCWLANTGRFMNILKNCHSEMPLNRKSNYKRYPVPVSLLCIPPRVSEEVYIEIGKKKKDV